MAHFAKVENGVVTQVIVIDQETLNLGHWGDPAQWKQTSYNTRGNIHYGQDGQPDGGVAVRGNYAGIGYIYDYANDVFYPPKPYTSWVMDTATWSWKAPTPMPEDAGTGTPPKMYSWDEPTTSWKEVTLPPA